MPEDARPRHFPVAISGIVSPLAAGEGCAWIDLKDGRRVHAFLSDTVYPGDHVRGADLVRLGPGRAYDVSQRKALKVEVLEVVEVAVAAG